LEKAPGPDQFKKNNGKKTPMKKILLALMVLACAASFASAGVGINWSTLFGAYDSDAVDLTGGDNALLDTYAVTWQLIYAGANNQIEAPDLSNGANGWVDALGDDVVWATRTISIGGGTASEDGTVWDNWMINQSGDTTYEDLAWSTAGFVYQRVFQGAPQGLSWYFDSALLALNTGYTGSPQLPQDFFADTLSEGFQPDQQFPAAPIPEPATMGLLGLGALVMAIRRRRA
jgi:hypothetical protein